MNRSLTEGAGGKDIPGQCRGTPLGSAALQADAPMPPITHHHKAI